MKTADHLGEDGTYKVIKFVYTSKGYKLSELYSIQPATSYLIRVKTQRSYTFNRRSLSIVRAMHQADASLKSQI